MLKFKKPVMLVDFDNTIAESADRIIEIYDEVYRDGFATFYDTSELQWNFEGIIESHHLDAMLGYFHTREFYDGLLIVEDAYWILKELSEKYEIVIVSKQCAKSANFKRKWIKEFFPFIERCIFLDQEGMDKSLIEGDIAIDDHLESISSIKAKTKICFGDYGYNKEVPYGILKADSWKEVRGILKAINSMGCSLTINNSGINISSNITDTKLYI